MQLIILGKNSDDKGTQLEKLTSSILREQGYTEVHTNVVRAGASEVDITAIFSQQYFGTTLIREVIGECKAYSKPISLPDWLKFLGKVFSEEINDKKIQGCFIALSGVNGNVTGHYNTIKAKSVYFGKSGSSSLLVKTLKDKIIDFAF
ncbi:restriction endonuclease [Pedobacter nyackensis]|uniref:Restriction endonuclease n=1 Tax=Pedobacter nyackensis TaxID=475255 RepID=A0A1W2ANQ3_9SPHI|nr:restriction endonuclease [Pedobacter nyackensis]SMC62234.1 Restriction endonuclease [Pedobacter nyackensis]